MVNIELNVEAPVFQMMDYKDDLIELSNFRGSNNILIVLNRGFV